jgi:hypothetical protein
MTIQNYPRSQIVSLRSSSATALFAFASTLIFCVILSVVREAKDLARQRGRRQAPNAGAFVEILRYGSLRSE